MANVIVIGGGASGLISAIYSAKSGNRVIILEKNNSCGKKLLITGNGHCNYLNEENNISHFHTSSNIYLGDIVNSDNIIKIQDFFKSIGIMPKIKQGYYYPMSNQAVSICNALIREAKLHSVEIKNNVFVSNVIKEENGFKIITDSGIFTCDKVVMATGSKAAPKTGSDGLGYEILKRLGHSTINVLPALVQLICNDKITKDWAGVRNDSLVSLYINGKKVREEEGEVMLTDYGLSGICIFNLSGKAAKELNKNNKVNIEINFLPSLQLNTTQMGIKWLDGYNIQVPKRTISELLDGLLNYKLVNAILKKTKINRDDKWNELGIEEKEKLINNLLFFKIEVDGTNSFDKAQVCSGGIPLEEINLKTMESNIIKEFYIVGELLDINGDCGGYNLTWAWISGMIAGKGTNKND